MSQHHTFKAPWGRQLKWTTALTSLLLLAIPLILLNRTPATQSMLFSTALYLPLAILLLAALFTVRGYRIERDTLLVLRPGWKTSIPLRALRQVTADAEAMKHSIRVFGNSGLFGYLGLFHNSRLGRYRAFATDQANAVVLEFPERKVVVTPDRPQQFVNTVTQLQGL